MQFQCIRARIVCINQYIGGPNVVYHTVFDQLLVSRGGFHLFTTDTMYETSFNHWISMFTLSEPQSWQSSIDKFLCETIGRCGKHCTILKPNRFNCLAMQQLQENSLTSDIKRKVVISTFFLEKIKQTSHYYYLFCCCDCNCGCYCCCWQCWPRWCTTKNNKTK